LLPKYRHSAPRPSDPATFGLSSREALRDTRGRDANRASCFGDPFDPALVGERDRSICSSTQLMAAALEDVVAGAGGNTLTKPGVLAKHSSLK